MPDARSWNITEQDHQQRFGCEGYVGAGAQTWLRGVDVRADPATTFRWVCQLRVAPYSYDLVDNLGRRSPRTLTPGLERLAVGQRFATVGRIVAVDPGRQITAVVAERPGRLFGAVAMSYLVRPVDGGSRLVAAMTVGAETGVQRLARAALAWGDLVMMRKQLLTLKQLAERGR